jgi:hypothetical protein
VITELGTGSLRLGERGLDMVRRLSGPRSETELRKLGRFGGRNGTVVYTP